MPPLTPRRRHPLAARPGDADSFDKKGPAFWRAVKGGDYLALSDAESFEAALSSGAAGAAVDYRVGEIRDFALVGPGELAEARRHGAPLRAASGAGRYRFLELGKEGEAPLYLAIVEGPGLFELRLYFVPSGLEGGTRDELIDRGLSWLFLPPADPEDFVSSELEYAPYPDVPELQELDAESGRLLSRKLVFARIGPACLYGEALDTGAPIILAEYEVSAPEGDSAQPPENPLLLAIEEGWMRADGTEPEEGGYVTIMLGKVIRPSELEHYPA
jgi:hypothetical protein